jgi:recombination protein RecA
VARFHELIDLGADRGLIEKSGAWFNVGGERLGPGRDKAAEALKQNTELASRIERELRDAVAAAKPVPAPTQAEAAA